MTTQQQAYIEGFLSMCAAAGVDPEALTKNAGPMWQSLFNILKAFGKGTARRFGSMGTAITAGKQEFSPKVLDMLGNKHPFTLGYRYGAPAAIGAGGLGLGGAMLGGKGEQPA